MSVHERMGRVIQALTYIPKGRSAGVSYEFRGIDAVMNHLHGPLAEAGLFLSPRVLDDWAVTAIPGTKDRVQYQATFRVCVDVYAVDGTMVTLGPGLAQSHDYGDKAVYQAQQNAIKYLLLEAFAIPTAEPDMDSRQADPSEVISDEEAAKRLTNRLKARALEVAGGDTEKATALFEAATDGVNITIDNVSDLESAIGASAYEEADS